MQSAKRFDTEAFLGRLTRFGQRCQKYYRNLPRAEANRIYGLQLIRSSSSPGANYIEALETASRRNFIYRLRVCRKEAREAVYWLELLLEANDGNLSEDNFALTKEGEEIIRIFTASIIKMENNDKQTAGPQIEQNS